MDTNLDPDEDVKIVLDPVYGTIHLDRLAVQIIDNPWFQRLRYIKQLAFADYVYPGATHTRFAHSIGVYHLARQMIKEIEAKPFPSGAAKMTPFDKRCIRIAALCHDLGHGPFSHLYEQIGKELNVMDMKHEDVSKAVMEKILIGDFFKECFKENLGKAIDLIKKLIKYPKNTKMTEEENLKKYMFQIVSNMDSGVDVDKWDYFNRDAIACGLPEQFQYDRALSVSRVVKMKIEGVKEDVFELAYRDYDAFNFYNMYNTRLTMYRKVYKHKAVVAVDLMMKDVFKLVKPKKKSETQGMKDVFKRVPEQQGNSGTERGSIELFPVGKEVDLTDDGKLTAFQNLNDSVLFTIQEKNQAAAELIDRIHKRDLYKMLIDILIPEDVGPAKKEKEIPEDVGPAKKEKEIPEDVGPAKKEKEIPEDVGPAKKEEEIPEDVGPAKKEKEIPEDVGPAKKEKEIPEDVGPAKKEEEIPEDVGPAKKEKEVHDKIKGLITDYGLSKVAKIKKIIFDYGDDGNDPVSKLSFYRKGESSGYKTSRNRVSLILPQSFQEVHLRVYSKRNTPVNDQFKKALEELENSIHEGAEGNTVSQADSNVQEPTSMEQDGKLD